MYFSNPAAYALEITNAFNGIKAAVEITTAGTIICNIAWSGSQLITNCSGQFKPSIFSFVKFLYYVNKHYDSLGLLTKQEYADLG